MAVAGRYEIVRPLGHGAMALVDLARDVELDRPVALKRLADNLARDEELHARFLREARLAARLSHPNIVRVYDVRRRRRRAVHRDGVRRGGDGRRPACSTRSPSRARGRHARRAALPGPRGSARRRARAPRREAAEPAAPRRRRPEARRLRRRRRAGRHAADDGGDGSRDSRVSRTGAGARRGRHACGRRLCAAAPCSTSSSPGTLRDAPRHLPSSAGPARSRRRLRSPISFSRASQPTRATGRRPTSSRGGSPAARPRQRRVRIARAHDVSRSAASSPRSHCLRSSAASSPRSSRRAEVVEAPPRPVARVAPVPHAPGAEQQARNLAAWLRRYENPAGG